MSQIPPGILIQPAERKGTSSYEFEWVAIDKHVLLVDVRRDGEYHGAFIGAVKGVNYREEAIEVAASGSPVWELFSAVYFEPAKGPYQTLLGRERFNRGIPILSWPEYVQRLPRGVIGVNGEIDRHVLFVAAECPGGTWGAYVGAVEGKDEFGEAPGVVAAGSEIPFDLAWVVFRDLGKGTEAGELKWHRSLENEPDLGQRSRKR